MTQLVNANIKGLSTKWLKDKYKLDQMNDQQQIHKLKTHNQHENFQWCSMKNEIQTVKPSFIKKIGL